MADKLVVTGLQTPAACTPVIGFRTGMQTASERSAASEGTRMQTVVGDQAIHAFLALCFRLERERAALYLSVMMPHAWY